MQRDVGYTIGLQWIYWAIYLVLLVNVLDIMAYGPASGALLDNSRVDRLITFRWYWVHCQTFGFVSPFITLWLMYHTWYDIFYLIHMVVVCASGALQILFGAMLVIDSIFVTCVGLCDGESLPGAELGTKPDWALILFTCVVGVQFVCNCLYVLFNFYLHRRTEMRGMLELAAASRAPPLSRAYMRRARFGGFRTFFDAFAPPGQHSLAFDPATGEAAQVLSQIGGAVGDHHGGGGMPDSQPVAAPTNSAVYIPLGSDV